MSIEEAIGQLAAAVRDNTEAVRANSMAGKQLITLMTAAAAAACPSGSYSTATPPAEKVEKPAEEKKAEAPKPAEEKKAEVPKPAEEKKAEAPKPKKVTVDDVRRALNSLAAKKGKDVATSVLRKHAPAVTELKEDQWASVVADCAAEAEAAF